MTDGISISPRCLYKSNIVDDVIINKTRQNELVKVFCEYKTEFLILFDDFFRSQDLPKPSPVLHHFFQYTHLRDAHFYRCKLIENTVQFSFFKHKEITLLRLDVFDDRTSECLSEEIKIYQECHEKFIKFLKVNFSQEIYPQLYIPEIFYEACKHLQSFFYHQETSQNAKYSETDKKKSHLNQEIKKLIKNNIFYDKVNTIGTIVHIAINSEYKGNIIISDEIKENVKEAIVELKNAGIKKTVMLTGDSKEVAEKVANDIGIDEVYSELLPSDKVNKLEEVLNKKVGNGKVLFVGDGINDAPVLARADIGIAMGGVGSDAAIEAADVVLMKDKIESISDAIRISRKTNKILWQNIIFSLFIKVAVMILVVAGLTNMWAAVFADVGVTLLAVLNSMRIIR